MKRLEFQTAHRAEGGLLYMQHVEGVAYGDHVLITDSQGNRRNGQVIKTSNDMVLVQILESTDDLSLNNTWVRFLDQPYELSLHPILWGVYSAVSDSPEMVVRQLFLMSFSILMAHP